jgi:hypothetical protein
MGGAIFSMGASTVPGSGVVRITNSTLTGNSAQGGAGSQTVGSSGGGGYGGALFNLDGSVTLNDATLAANTVAGGSHGAGGSSGQAGGGAVYNLAFGKVIQTGGATSANLVLFNSILSTTRGGPDLASNAINGKKPRSRRHHRQRRPRTRPAAKQRRPNADDGYSHDEQSGLRARQRRRPRPARHRSAGPAAHRQRPPGPGRL